MPTVREALSKGGRDPDRGPPSTAARHRPGSTVGLGRRDEPSLQMRTQARGSVTCPRGPHNAGAGWPLFLTSEGSWGLRGQGWAGQGEGTHWSTWGTQHRSSEGRAALALRSCRVSLEGRVAMRTDGAWGRSRGSCPMLSPAAPPHSRGPGFSSTPQDPADAEEPTSAMGSQVSVWGFPSPGQTPLCPPPLTLPDMLCSSR